MSALLYWCHTTASGPNFPSSKCQQKDAFPASCPGQKTCIKFSTFCIDVKVFFCTSKTEAWVYFEQKSLDVYRNYSYISFILLFILAQKQHISSHISVHFPFKYTEIHFPLNLLKCSLTELSWCQQSLQPLFWPVTTPLIPFCFLSRPRQSPQLASVLLSCMSLCQERGKRGESQGSFKNNNRGFPTLMFSRFRTANIWSMLKKCSICCILFIIPGGDGN